MAEVIDLHGRRKGQRKGEGAEEATKGRQRRDAKPKGPRSRRAKPSPGRLRRKAQAVAAALACGLCPHRCAYCGLPIEDPVFSLRSAPYPFCDPCREEYLAFLRYQEGITDHVEYWHTEAWAAMWRSWLEHMKAGERFRRSPEFLRLMQENQE